MGAPGRSATCHLTDFNESLPVERVYPKTQKDTLVSVLDLFGGEVGHPPGFTRFLPRKLPPYRQNVCISGQLYLTYCYQVLYTYWYIYSECKDQVTADLVSCLSINGHKYVTMFLDPQIFDNFEVKYLPLPKRYDTNFNVPLSIDH